MMIEHNPARFEFIPCSRINNEEHFVLQQSEGSILNCILN